MLRIVPIAVCTILLGGCNGSNKEIPSSQQKPDVPAAQRSTAPPAKLQDAKELHRQGQSAKALELVREVLIASPENIQALAVAADIHLSAGQHCQAAELASKLAEADPQNAAATLVRAFDSYMRCGDYTAAEASLSRGVQLAPDNADIRRLLAQLLNAQGRRYEASEHVRELIRMRVIRPNEMLSLVDLSGPFALASFEEIVDDTESTLFLLGNARTYYVASKAEPQEVISLLQRVTSQFPESTAAAAFYGRVLSENGRLAEFQNWLEDLPAGIAEQPEYWHAIGTWLAQVDRHQEAIRSFGESLRRDPTNRASLRSMIASLEYIGQPQLASMARKRLADLDQIYRIARDADGQQAAWISEKLQELVRPWESAAWLMRSGQMRGQLQQLVPQLDGRHEAIVAWESGATAEQILDARLERMLGFEITDYSMPNLKTPTESPAKSVVTDRDTGLQFAEIASQVGLSAQYAGGFDVESGRLFPYQVNGSGLAALDYDLDGRCDLYVVQAGGKPNDPEGSKANQLFRLLPDQRFRETTAAAASGDRGLGQGVCAGDVNQDGFPDLLVANIGTNSLYLNQGDGTFAPASDLIGENRDRWTSSLGLGDLDGDHLPDIIEINYIDDPKAYQIECDENYTDCQPQRFDEAADRIYRCRDDGTLVPWQTITRAMSETPKYGFGLVIANFDRRHGNDVFVSNDGSVNHYWSSTPAQDPNEDAWELVEAASAYGCGVGRRGDSQACMGIAAGDFNRDGRLDLHVTNFHNEPANLFMQTPAGFFSDEVLKYRLQQPSFGVLGFGTQSADLDNDGWLDLAVLNGHVFDARHEGVPYRMLPQLYRGSPQGFALQRSDSLGEYWQRKQLGRTLAMLDWNRDGRIDLIANHLDLPLALLQNDSPAESWLQLELVGVSSERDANGAEVRVVSGSEEWTAWQTGGDGLMVSNEPVVHFGLGSSQSIDEVQVRWPAGLTQTFTNVEPNHRYVVIEGDSTPFRR